MQIRLLPHCTEHLEVGMVLQACSISMIHGLDRIHGLATCRVPGYLGGVLPCCSACSSNERTQHKQRTTCWSTSWNPIPKSSLATCAVLECEVKQVKRKLAESQATLHPRPLLKSSPAVTLLHFRPTAMR